ncbi:hypothetical protein B6U99_02065 [Candidatus Geothermarchaeota archaeon ex4572_27]|nr:MAG: hypothetical protein B6U99_02065 [Candidatus Geothermarchaeota archaeon ex4572_27]
MDDFLGAEDMVKVSINELLRELEEGVEELGGDLPSSIPGDTLPISFLRIAAGWSSPYLSRFSARFSLASTNHLAPGNLPGRDDLLVSLRRYYPQKAPARRPGTLVMFSIDHLYSS